MLQTLLAAPLFIGAAGALGGCSRPESASALPMASSTVTRQPADPALAAYASWATSRFGFGLLRTLAPTPPRENLLISPYSIIVALAMTRLGARGETATQMDAVLAGENADSLTRDAPPSTTSTTSTSSTTSTPAKPAESAIPRVAPIERLGGGLNALGQQLASYAGDVAWNGERVKIAWSEANSLWGQNDTPWEQPFLDSIARYFGGGMHQVDYKGATEQARTAINAWTKEKTAGKIPEILEPGSLDAMMRLVLVNAIHFKAPWASPFTKSLTTAAPFTRPDGSKVDVQMMHGEASGVRAGAGMPGFSAVRLQYASLKFAFTAVLPDEGHEEAVHRLITGNGLGDIMAGLSSSADQRPGPTTDVRPANLAMPRFSMKYGTQLNEALISLGMPSAFDASRADLSGMTTAEQLYIAFVVHQATMDVDEEGTEAAAATAVGARAVSAPVEPMTVTLDRPFYVVLHDTETDTPLFVGYVADPTAGSS